MVLSGEQDKESIIYVRMDRKPNLLMPIGVPPEGYFDPSLTLIRYSYFLAHVCIASVILYWCLMC